MNISNIIGNIEIDIEEYANQIAELQRLADIAYYMDHDLDKSTKILDNVDPIKKRCIELGICNKVYERAYQIYNFKNSGRPGYMLYDGRIVKNEYSKS